MYSCVTDFDNEEYQLCFSNHQSNDTFALDPSLSISNEDLKSTIIINLNENEKEKVPIIFDELSFSDTIMPKIECVTRDDSKGTVYITVTDPLNICENTSEQQDFQSDHVTYNFDGILEATLNEDLDILETTMKDDSIYLLNSPMYDNEIPQITVINGYQNNIVDSSVLISKSEIHSSLIHSNTTQSNNSVIIDKKEETNIDDLIEIHSSIIHCNSINTKQSNNSVSIEKEKETKIEDLIEMIRNSEELNKEALLKITKNLTYGDRLTIRNLILPKKQCRKNPNLHSYIECKLCSAKFNTTNEFKGHVHDITNITWRCNMCDCLLDLDDNHTDICIKANYKYICSPCNLSFTKNYLYDNHQYVFHQKAENLKCRLCSKMFKLHYDLKRHVNVHLNIKKYICDVCGLKFNHSSNLIRHHRSHTLMKPYVCNICGLRFTDLMTHKKHHSSHNIGTKTDTKSKGNDKTIQRKIYCSVCGLTFASKSQLKEHESCSHTGTYFPCLSCGFTYSSVDDLKQHSCLDKYLHKSDSSSTKESCLSFNVKCDGYLFDINTNDIISIGSQKDLNNDLVNDNNEFTNLNVGEQFEIYSATENVTSEIKKDSRYCDIVPKPSIDSSVDNSSKKAKKSNEPKICKVCNKVFKRNWNLKQHEATHNAALRSYVCSTCGKTFSYRSVLTKHEEGHNKSINCDICDKPFKCRDNLLQHKKTVHLKIKKFHCDLCGKGYYKKSDFDYHMRIHLKINPYMCSKCGNKFSHLSGLIRHERTHYAVKPFKCTVCPQTFSQKSGLKLHMKKHENTTSTHNNQPIEQPPKVTFSNFTTNVVIKVEDSILSECISLEDQC